MPVSPSFIDFAKETFAPFGEVSVRKMFGGAGVYCDGLFFALIADDAVYLKVDDVTRSDFEQAGLEPFIFEMKNGAKGAMNYHAAPEGMYDDEDELRRWATLALDAARRAAKLKPNRKRTAKKAVRQRK